MPLQPQHLFGIAWLAWAVYWAVSARGVKAVRRIETPLSLAGHVVPLWVAAALLAAPLPFMPELGRRWLPWPEAGALAGAAITALGLAFTVWARRLLGGNWSSTVAVKEGHELVLAGPYRFVRHPIYSGLLVAFAGSAVARGDWRGVLALLVAWLALWRKWRLEERFMRETFGSAYAEYAARTPAVIPRLF